MGRVKVGKAELLGALKPTPEWAYWFAQSWLSSIQQLTSTGLQGKGSVPPIPLWKIQTVSCWAATSSLGLTARHL